MDEEKERKDTVFVLGIKSVPDVYSPADEIELVQLSEPDTSENEEGENLILENDTSPSTSITQEPKLKKTLNLFNAVTFIVGDIIGSGIFIAPTTAFLYSGSFGMSLIFWVIGGVLSIAGGLVFVELGLLIKDSGADYAYLREGYSFGGKHPALRTIGNTLCFLSVWSSCLIVRPLSISIISQSFSVYICQAIGGGVAPPDLSVKLVATSAILAVTLINMISVKATAMVINVFTVTKVLALVFIMVLGLWQLIVGDHNDNFKNAFEGTTSDTGDIALAFYSILFAYSGWNSLGYIVEESVNAERNLIRGIFIAIPLVTVCYISVNIAYYAGLSKTQLLSSPATALTFAESVLGKAGLVIIPLLVASSTFGSAMFGMFAGPRTSFSAARDGNLPEVFCLLQNTSKTPVPATIFQCVMGLIFVFGGSINQLINGLGITEWIFYGLVFIACIILRFTNKTSKRPFKVWIIIPILMIIVSLFLIIVPIILAPDERLISFIVIIMILAGLPVYFLFGWDRLRPRFINRFSEKLTSAIALLFDSTSARNQTVS